MILPEREQLRHLEEHPHLPRDHRVEVDRLARIVAHQVERPAAPVTSFVLGLAAGRTDADPEQLEKLAARAQALAEGWDRPADAPDPDDVDDPIPDDSTVDHSTDEFDD